MTGKKDDRVFVAHILDEASFVMETMSSMTWEMNPYISSCLYLIIFN